MRACDCSAYYGSPVPLELLEELRDNQHVGLIIAQVYGGGPTGVGPNPYYRRTIQNAQEAGLLCAAYVWPPSATANAANLILYGPDAPLLFCAIDVELRGQVEITHVNELRSHGIAPVVYTSRGAWAELMAGNEEFARLPLWDASYRWGASLEWPSAVHEALWVPYGGWDHRVGWQFRGTTTAFGGSFDLNVFDDAWIAGLLAGEEGMTMPPQPTDLVNEDRAYKIARYLRAEELRRLIAYFQTELVELEKLL